MEYLDSGEEESAALSNENVKDDKKIIKNYNYSYETEDFDEAYAYLKQQIQKFSGYVSSSEIYGNDRRTLSLTARIPAAESDRFVGQLGSLGTIISQSESAEDITLQYTDTQSRITSLKKEQERLLKLLDQADSLDSIVALENRLTDVRYELENYESQRKLYDDMVAYSTVNISLEEVAYTVAVDESTFFTRVKTGLKKSFRDIRSSFVNFVVDLIIALPYLAIWGVILFLIVWIIRKMVKRMKRRRAVKQVVEKGTVTEESDGEHISMQAENQYGKKKKKAFDNQDERKENASVKKND